MMYWKRRRWNKWETVWLFIFQISFIILRFRKCFQKIFSKISIDDWQKFWWCFSKQQNFLFACWSQKYYFFFSYLFTISFKLYYFKYIHYCLFIILLLLFLVFIIQQYLFHFFCLFNSTSSQIEKNRRKNNTKYFDKINKRNK